MVAKYFEKIERTISKFKEIINHQTISKKFYNDTQGLISGKIVFINDNILEFMELKETESKTKMKYKYHYMDNQNEMIFRYDNAKHHPEISTFPHHKHTTKQIIDSGEPELIDVLFEIQQSIST